MTLRSRMDFNFPTRARPLTQFVLPHEVGVARSRWSLLKRYVQVGMQPQGKALMALLALCLGFASLTSGQEDIVPQPRSDSATLPNDRADSIPAAGALPAPPADAPAKTRPGEVHGEPGVVESPAITATLYIVEADWSKSPSARLVEDDLREAFKDLKLTPEQRENLLKAAPEILFATEIVPQYTEAHASYLLRWLRQHGLVKAVLSSVEEKYVAPGDTSPDPGTEVAAGESERPRTSRVQRRLEILDQEQLLPQKLRDSASDGPFISRSNVQQWLIVWEPAEGSHTIGVHSSTVIFEQRRGETKPRNLGSRRPKEAYFDLPEGFVAIVGTETVFDSSLAHRKGATPAAKAVQGVSPAAPGVIGVLVIGRTAPSLDGLAAEFTVPDRIGTVKHERSHPIDQESARSPSPPRRQPASAAPRAPAELARFAGTWRVTEVVSPAEGTPSPDDDFELRIAGDTFSLEGASVRGAGTLQVDPARTPPTFKFVFLKDNVPTGGHLAGTYGFPLDGTLWLSMPDTSVRPGAGEQPHKILKLAKIPEHLDPRRPGRLVAGSGGGTARPSVTYKFEGSAIAELRTQYEAKEREARRLAERVRTASDADPATTGLKNELISAVYRAFALRQQLNRVELKQLEERLARSRRAIEARETNRDQIVKRRVNDLLNPDLNWNDWKTSADTTGTSGSPNVGDPEDRDTDSGSTTSSETQRAVFESEYRAFEAEWQIVMLEDAGKVTATPPGTKNRITVKDGVMEGGRISLKPTARPRQLDLSFNNGPGNEIKSIRGIYEWVDQGSDGNGPARLRIRIPHPDLSETENRPVDFEQAGNFRTILLERVGDVPANAPATQARPEAQPQ